MADNKEENIIKVPRFKKENGFLTTKQRSVLMSKIKGKNTSSEILFRKTIWKLGFRYRLHNKKLPGNPDILFKKYMIVIFIDGEFWHGYKWDEKKPKINTNRDFWIPKIERNMQRDNENNKKLTNLGYKVFRFWDKTIKKNVDDCVSEIVKHIEMLQNSAR